ncbi:hypothetical protein, partial [Endozoicomonas sp. ONNA2]|uniref:hypothetical protein n=1 Tax=Endozoicomonas sp. ONNA2 TaxID=2828741 RepID=UPI002147EDCE
MGPVTILNRLEKNMFSPGQAQGADVLAGISIFDQPGRKLAKDNWLQFRNCLKITSTYSDVPPQSS